MLDTVLAFTMMGFTFWNWFLAHNGNTTIEYFTKNNTKKRNGVEVKPQPLNFRNWRDNFYRVFGT